MWRVLQAEVLKQLRLPLARTLTVGVWAVGAMIAVIQGLTHATKQLDLRDLFGATGGFHAWSFYWAAVTFFAPGLVAAWGVGFEQSQDTWKTVLVRHGTRWPFVVAKLKVAVGWVLAMGLGSGALWVAIAALMGQVFGTRPPFEPAGALSSTAEVLVQSLAAITLMPFAQAIALRSRGNGTAVGAIAALGVSMACRMLSGTWRALDRLSPVTAPEAVVRFARGSVEDRQWLDALLGADWSAWASALVIVAWVVVPLTFSLVTFERKDVVSELG
jgi:ABC-type transport system involved in multi-copper enzyme maturation permease subunit